MMRRMLLILLLATAGLGPVQAADPIAEVVTESLAEPAAAPLSPGDAALLLQHGIELFQAGRYAAAQAELHRLIVTSDDPQLIDRAHLALARLHYARNEPDTALLNLERIAPQTEPEQVQLLKGAALVASGMPEAGLALLLALEGTPLEPTDQLLRYGALSDAQSAVGQPLQALFFLYRGLQVGSGPQLEPLLAQAHRIFQEQLDDAALAEAAFMFQGSPLGQDAALQQARRALQRGDRQLAGQLLDRVVQQPVPFPYRSDAVRLWEELTGNSWLQRAVGVVLPLSGRYAPFGTQVRRGMELAVEAHNAGGGLPTRFIFQDGGADAEQSVQALVRLTTEERVMAVAGPLTSSPAAAVAAQAQLDRVPLLALSQREGLPETGDYIFRNSLTGRLQARALARYAVEEQGMSAFGILHPETRQGRELARQFAEEVLQRGGLVTALESYPDDATTFGRQIKLLKGEDPDAPPLTPEEEAQAELEDLFVPDFPAVDFDALFIPDYAYQVGLIAPQLAYYGVEEVQLLGINGWNSPELVRVAGQFVEGAVFVDGFFRYSPYPFVSEFVNRFYERYGEEPEILEAQGYDIANILLTVLDRPDVASREEVRRALALLQSYPGVTGATSFTLSGEADKVLFLLQVQNGNIVQIN